MKTILLSIFLCICIQSNAQWTFTAVPSAGLIESIKFVSPTKGFVCGLAGFSTTPDGGTTWSSTAMLGLKDMDFLDSLTGFAVGIGGIMKKTVNGGNTWTTLTPPQSNTLWGVSIISSSVAYFSVTGGLVYKTMNGGSTFVIQNAAPGSVTLTDIFFTDQFNGCVTGSNGSIYKTSNGGSSWTQVYTTPAPAGLNSIYFVNSTTGYAVGSSGSVAKTTNGGAAWNTLNSGTMQHLNYVHFFDVDYGIIAGDTATVLTSGNGGLSWYMDNVGTSNLKGAYLLSPTTGIVGALNGIYKNINYNVGNEELQRKHEFKAFPNPVHSSMQIETTISSGLLTIYDATGRLVSTYILNQHQLSIDLSALSRGSYFALAQDEKYFRKAIHFIKE